MEKFWIVQNGILGTAHISRDGRLVDFRPTRPVFDFIESGQFVVYPSKGQLLEPLYLKPVKIDEVVKVDYPKKGMKQITKIFLAHYMGVEICATVFYPIEMYDPKIFATVHVEIK